MNTTDHSIDLTQRRKGAKDNAEASKGETAHRPALRLCAFA
jgi:hypothetical protein